MKTSARPRLIDLLLRLLPRDFRDRFGSEMESALDQEWKASSAKGGSAKLSFFWRAMGDLLTTVPREHLADLGSDLRYAWRTLRRQPLFVTATVVSLAIGIAATTSVLAIFEATFGRGIPGVVGQEELVNVKVSSDFEETFQLTSYPSFLDLRQSGVLSDLAGFSGMRMSWSQSEEAIPQLLSVQAVTPNYFSVLGVSASLGRLFDSVDEERESGVVVLSHWLWCERYACDPTVLGRTLRLNGEPYSVVGVATPGFRGHFVGFHFDAFITTAMGERAGLPDRRDRATNWVEMVGRVAEGGSLDQVLAGMDLEAERLERAWPEIHRGLEITAEPCTGIDADLRGGLAAFLAILAVVSGFVLVIGCVNVANLMLGRLVQRAPELRLRTALGAPRSRLARQQLIESALLALAGGALGSALALQATHLASRALPGLGDIQLDVRFDPRTLGAACAISLGAALVFGLLPALRAARSGIGPSARGVAGSDARSRRMRSALVVVQVALSAVVLVTAGLFLRALDRGSTLDPGFDPERVILVRLDPSLAGIEAGAGRALLGSALELASALPGVESAALSAGVPLSLGARFFPNTTEVQVPGVEPPPQRDGFAVENSVVSAGYLETLRIPLVEGRELEHSDTSAVMVNHTFAERFFPDGDALGSTLQLESGEAEIVGVARDSRYRTLDEGPTPFLYRAFAGVSPRRGNLLVRASPERGDLVVRLRERLQALAPELPLGELGMLEDQLAVSFLPQRVAGLVTGALGLVGLFLTAVGLYGVLAHMVSSRASEIGVRMSLGARPRDIVAMVLRSGLKLALLGLALGWVVAGLASRGLVSFLYGLSPFDAWTYASIAILLLGTAALAGYVPARRATRIDPLRVLRRE